MEITSANPRVNTGNTPATAKVGTYVDVKLQNFLNEATKIELLAGTLGKPNGDAPSTNNSISAAKLLQGVKKSNSDEEILSASKVVDENGERKVVAVPFTSPENLRQTKPEVRFIGEMRRK